MTADGIQLEGLHQLFYKKNKHNWYYYYSSQLVLYTTYTVAIYTLVINYNKTGHALWMLTKTE